MSAIYEELKEIFAKSGIKLSRSQVRVKTMNYDTRDGSLFDLYVHPVFEVRVGNGKIYEFSLGDQLHYDLRQVGFSIGSGHVFFHTEYNDLGEVKQQGCWGLVHIEGEDLHLSLKPIPWFPAIFPKETFIFPSGTNECLTFRQLP